MHGGAEEADEETFYDASEGPNKTNECIMTCDKLLSTVYDIKCDSIERQRLEAFLQELKQDLQSLKKEQVKGPPQYKSMGANYLWGQPGPPIDSAWVREKVTETVDNWLAMGEATIKGGVVGLIAPWALPRLQQMAADYLVPSIMQILSIVK